MTFVVKNTYVRLLEIVMSQQKDTSVSQDSAITLFFT